jgi:hypothetical protein
MLAGGGGGGSGTASASLESGAVSLSWKHRRVSW